MTDRSPEIADPNPRAAQSLRAPLFAALAVSAASFLAWDAIREQDDTAIQAWSEIRAREAATALLVRVQLFELSFDRMARRHEFDPDPDGWLRDAERYLEGFPAVSGIAWMSAEHASLSATDDEVERDCVPQTGDAFWTSLANAAQEAKLHWTLGATATGEIICVYAPRRSGEERGEYFTAAARGRKTMQGFMPKSEPGVFFQGEIDRFLAFAADESSWEESAGFGAEHRFFVDDIPITIRARPSLEKIAELRPPTANLVLLGGHLVAVLVGVCIGAMGAARQRARQLAEEIRRRGAAEAQLARHAAALEDARDLAESASRAKSEFLANMSHEIRTPLNAVVGLTEMLLHTDIDSRQRDYLETVMGSSELLLSVLNDILDFSKIEAGKLGLEEVPFDLRDVVGDTLRSLAVMANAKEIEVAGLVSPDLPSEFIGDPARLRQVLTNLLGNALKFTERGEIIVRVEPEEIADTALLHFSVRDTGIGISSEQIDRLFESFEQADASTTRRFGGTGLGLAISQQLVTMMGGTIGVESRLDEGSTFHFTARFGIGTATGEKPNTEKVDLSERRVLIVDDHATNRAILEELARSEGMIPVLAANAAEGIARLNEAFEADRAFDVLLSDVQMPERDGFDMIEEIRSDARHHALEILVLSSAEAAGDQKRCESLRVAAQLLKPVKQCELFDRIRRALAENEPLPDVTRLSRARSSATQDPPAPSTGPLRILLAEDSAANRKVALAMLGSQGHEIEVAENGQRAVALARARAYDVILMDIEMPEMDGYQAAAAIRAFEEETGGRVAIVAMTAHVMEGVRERCVEAGMDDYITKPMRRAQLLEALSRVGLIAKEIDAASGD